MRILFTPKNGKNSCGKKFLKKNLMARGFGYRACPGLETIGAKKMNPTEIFQQFSDLR